MSISRKADGLRQHVRDVVSPSTPCVDRMYNVPPSETHNAPCFGPPVKANDYNICHCLSKIYHPGLTTNRSMLHLYQDLSADYRKGSQICYRACERAVLLFSAEHHPGVALGDHHSLLRDDKIKHARCQPFCRAALAPPRGQVLLITHQHSLKRDYLAQRKKRVAAMSHSI